MEIDEHRGTAETSLLPKHPIQPTKQTNRVKKPRRK